jgi:hypothetical protein
MKFKVKGIVQPFELGGITLLFRKVAEDHSLLIIVTGVLDVGGHR